MAPNDWPSRWRPTKVKGSSSESRVVGLVLEECNSRVRVHADEKKAMTCPVLIMLEGVESCLLEEFESIMLEVVELGLWEVRIICWRCCEPLL